MLKIPVHQVAGHNAVDGQLGPLVDDSGCFYKPLQSDERGSNELAFYTSFSSSTKIPNHIRRFFPAFHGTRLIEASNGSGLHPHLVLQDLTCGCINPSIMDAKIGSRTWAPESSEDYIKKCLAKDRETSSLSMGFRASGLQIYVKEELGFWKPGKKITQKYSIDDMKLVLRKFVSSNVSIGSDSEPDCSFASNVYGGSSGILAQLLELKAWFEYQTIFHFYACSVLLVHEEGRSSGAEVKLVDFAHVVDAKGVIDHNFLGGLCSLIQFISDVLSSSNECKTKACLQEAEKNQSCYGNGSI